MTTIKAFIKSHPLLSFYAIAFAVSWGGLIMVVGGPSEILGTPQLLGKRLALVMLAWLAGPSVASILMTGLVHGRAGFRDLLTRMTRWRVGARWYAVALLTTPLYLTAILLAFSLSSPELLPRILTTSDKASLLLFGIGWGLIGGGLLEELGWTGFAVPTLLRQRYGVLSTGLLVGVPWGVLHFLAFFYLGRPSAAIPLAIFVPLDFFIAVVGLTAYRVLMVWVYDRTGESMLVAMLMHASYTACALILTPLALAGVAFLAVTFAGAAVLWVFVAAVAMVNGGHLSRQSPLRRRVA
jgi:uncharacterized protein